MSQVQHGEVSSICGRRSTVFSNLIFLLTSMSRLSLILVSILGSTVISYAVVVYLLKYMYFWNISILNNVK